MITIGGRPKQPLAVMLKGASDNMLLLVPKCAVLNGTDACIKVRYVASMSLRGLRPRGKRSSDRLRQSQVVGQTG